MSKYNPLISQRRPEFASFSDADIQNQYAKADRERKALIIDLDCCISLIDIGTVEKEIDVIDRVLFALDDELCARGL